MLLLIEYLISLLVFFVEFIIFVITWLFLLTGFLHNVKFFFQQFFGKYSTYLSATLTISIIFELIKNFNELQALKAATIASGPPLSCHSHLLGLITLSPSCSSYFIAFNDNLLWKLNPFIILCSLSSNVLVALAEMLGKVTGRFVASLLYELPWLYQLPVLILFTFSILSSIAIFKNYNFNFFYGSIDMSASKRQKSPQAPPVPPHRCFPVPPRINSLANR